MAAALDLICGAQQQTTKEKKEGKKKNKELDAQTNLLERGIEFLHIHHFCCPLRVTETEWDETKMIYELYEEADDFLAKVAGRM